jgi:hypothetical protein
LEGIFGVIDDQAVVTRAEGVWLVSSVRCWRRAVVDAAREKD